MKSSRPFVLSGALAAATVVGAGSVTYTLQTAADPTADQVDAYARIRKAMDSAVGFYDAYTSIRKGLTIQYNPDVSTADGSSGGNIRFGSSRSYMVVATAMHEIAHTVGVGTTNQWTSQVSGGFFTGAAATAALRGVERNDTVRLHADNQHFWPYGLNYASEVKSESDLVAHCKVVEGIVQDLFHERTYFEGRVRNVQANACISLSGTSLVLGGCADTASFVRIVSLSDTLYRLELGDFVLDVPNQSKASGAAVSTYSWNGGTNQEFRILPSPLSSVRANRLQMVHSGLYLRSTGSSVVQDPTSAGTGLDWELVPRASTSVLPSGVGASAEPAEIRRLDPLGRRLDPGRSLGPVERLGTLPGR